MSNNCMNCSRIEEHKYCTTCDDTYSNWHKESWYYRVREYIYFRKFTIAYTLILSAVFLLIVIEFIIAIKTGYFTGGKP